MSTFKPGQSVDIWPASESGVIPAWRSGFFYGDPSLHPKNRDGRSETLRPSANPAEEFIIVSQPGGERGFHVTRPGGPSSFIVQRVKLNSADTGRIPELLRAIDLNMEDTLLSMADWGGTWEITSPTPHIKIYLDGAFRGYVIREPSAGSSMTISSLSRRDAIVATLANLALVRARACDGITVAVGA